jgi:hypothetical protein
MLVFAGSCVSVKWNPKTGDVVYQRFGDQKLSGIHIEDANGFYVAIESQESEARLLTDVLNIAKEWYKVGAGTK